MKFVICFLFLVLSLNAMAIITTPSSNSKDALGEVTLYDKVFISVQASEALVAGEVAVLSLATDDGMTVEDSATNTRKPLCVVDAAIASGAFGRCQIFGYGSVLYDAGVPATAGNQAFISGSNAGYATGIAAPVATQFPIGEFLDTESYTSGTAEVFIRLL